MGYLLIGAMIERAAGKTWDELMVERIFEPLGMQTAGLGNQASLGRTDAPLGHSVEKGVVKVFLAGPNGDNPPVIGPAGIAHMSILDFARWAGWNAGEGKRGPALVKPETLKKLHEIVVSFPPIKGASPGTPSHGGYAMGWGQIDVEWAPNPVLYHEGSNDKNVACIFIDLQNDFAIVAATNTGGQQADDALAALARELYRKYAVQVKGQPRK